MKKIIITSDAPAPIGPYNQAVVANGFLYASGQIAIEPQSGNLIKTDIISETHQVMKNILAILKKANLGFENVIKTTIYLKDMENFSQINTVYGSYFKDNFPARETVEAARLPKDANVEISFIAAV